GAIDGAGLNVVSGATFSPDERRILTWSVDGTARIWHATTGMSAAAPLKHGPGGDALLHSINGASFTKGGSQILTWSSDGTARVWDGLTGEPLTPPMKHQNEISGAV